MDVPTLIIEKLRFTKNVSFNGLDLAQDIGLITVLNVIDYEYNRLL